MSKLTVSPFAIALLLVTNAAAAYDFRPNAPSCGERDLQATTIIEMHGAAQDVPAGAMYGAAVAQQLARSACRQGRTDEALA